MKTDRSLTKFLASITVVLTLATAPAYALERAIEGALTHVDSAAKKVAVKTEDGSEEVFKYSDKTIVRTAGTAKRAGVDTYLGGKEGSHVIIHYTGEGADRSAVAIDDFGKDSLKVDKGVIKGVDRGAHTVTVTAEDGSDHVYRFAKDGVVDSERGAVKGTQYTAHEGERVSVHYTEEAGEKLVHLIKVM